MDYSKTLNLPKTDFPMRGNLPQREPQILDRWAEEDAYHELRKTRKGRKKFILHDGPPYANGNIHLGTALNKILKDIVVRYNNMLGYDCPYIPGWDTHGLPIEQQAIKSFGLNRHEIETTVFRDKCKEFALKYMGIQREEFKRLGVWGEWDDPYLTLKPEYEAAQIEVFGKMAEKGYIYKGLKPVYWCADCETALAEAEVEYADHKSPSIYVRFQVKNGKGLLKDGQDYVVIWTTTPWTLPGNVAISVSPSDEYVLVEFNGAGHLLAASLYKQVIDKCEITDYKVIKEIHGKDLEGIVCSHPFLDRDSLVIVGEHVTMDQGTGCVHTAPGHGMEDYEVGLKYGLDILSPINDHGVLTSEAGPFAGQFYDKANKAITAHLEENGALLKLEFMQHSYPHCWRCKKPVIYRATEQWFASVKGFREEALKAIRDVNWIPTWGEERIYNMVEGRNDWCISRQRTWGVPIPIFYCGECNAEVVSNDTIASVAELFRKEGSNAWFAKSAEEILPDGFKCPHCGHTGFRKETDIMDVWFDSGSSHAAVCEAREELEAPVDLYLEGSDQHRGWFQSSLLTSVATRGRAPYKSVLTHGYVVDGEGRKMSKSVGNVIAPQEVIKDYGVDVLRLWVASSDFKSDIRVSKLILQQMAEVYRKIRNTMRYLLANTYDFNPATDKVAFVEMGELDKWALLKLDRLVDTVGKAYDTYEYHQFYHAVRNFCVVEMSSFYIDVCKERLYVLEPDNKERRAAQTVMYEVLNVLVRLIAPVLAFTAEEVWNYMPLEKAKSSSVHFAAWPEKQELSLDSKMEKKWDRILMFREEITKALELARQEKVIGNSLDARVDIYTDSDTSAFLLAVPDLREIFIVSEIHFHTLDAAPDKVYAAETEEDMKITVEKSHGTKCERCWVFTDDIGSVDEHPTLCNRCGEVVGKLHIIEE